MNVVTQAGSVSFNGEHWSVLVQYRGNESLAGMGFLQGEVRGYTVLHFDCEEDARNCLPGWRFD